MPTPEQLQERPFFDAGRLPNPGSEYVGWFDVVGTQSHLTQSHKRAANFFAKIHLAALRCREDPVRLYPVMDGVYVTSPSRSSFVDFVHAFYRLLSVTFCGEEKCQHRFVVRGAVAFGPVTHGRTIPGDCAHFENPPYRDALLIGMPMVHAYQAEHQAPPFGIFIHDSGRSFAPAGDAPLSGRWWRWWRAEDEPLISEMRVALPQFYSWALGHAQEFDYPPSRIAEHRATAFEYFEIATG